MSNLVIVESPAKANTIKGYLGSGYKVTASKGHVRDLPKSTLGVDIDNNFEARYINIRGKGPLISELKKEAKNANKVFLATDPDREGEAISWHLANALGIDPSKAKRISFNEITKSAVKAAIKNPQPINMDLVNSQQTRRILDRIVGYKASPFLWKTLKSGLSAGRVQSVATRLIVEREEEIRAFVPTEYWTITAQLLNSQSKALKAVFYGDKNGKMELGSKEESDKIFEQVTNGNFVVESVKKAVKNRNPAPPFTTSTLQQEASRKLNFRSQKIMQIAQELYEGINLGSENGGVHGLITYMRTDSLRISQEASEAAENYIKSKYGEEYYPAQKRFYKSKSNSQDAHEAIRPSSMKFDPDTIKKYLSSDQYKLYKLIWDRFLASQMASAQLNTVNAEIVSNGYIFHSSGYNVKFPGFLSVYDPGDNGEFGDTEKQTKLVEISEGEILKQKEVLPEQHFTEPAPRYTEASLVKQLEEKGIGRPSTYTPIITTIIARDYVTRDGKSLKPTYLGEMTTKLIMENFPDIIDYKFTAQLEDRLDSIENGNDNMLNVLSEFYDGFKLCLAKAEEAAKNGEIDIPPEETDIICEHCGVKMIVKNGRYGKFAACPNYPECRNTKPLDKNGKPKEEKAEKKETKEADKTGMICELCGSEMVIRSGKFGSFYACSAYPKCKNTKQITKDTGVACPVCGSKIVTKQGGKKHITFYSCEKYPECNFSSWDMPTEEKCPECGDILLVKKRKKLVYCRNEKCNYSREESKKD
ncbi:MAG: type I DNA topoisomerase [Ruminococcaceae bacterium]|nr:type I DNA topoisomerase [Oscillospiraceae bacterium]